MRCGVICRSCSGECVDAPTPAEPLELFLGGRTVTIDSCPRQMVPHEYFEAVEYADFARDGHWPVAGGVLDQAEWFRKATRIIWAEEDHHEAQRWRTK